MDDFPPENEDENKILDGQMDMAELLFRPEEKGDEEEPQRDDGLVNGQIGFDFLDFDEGNMKKKDDEKKELLNKLNNGTRLERDEKELGLLKKVSTDSSSKKSSKSKSDLLKKVKGESVKESGDESAKKSENSTKKKLKEENKSTKSDSKKSNASGINAKLSKQMDDIKAESHERKTSKKAEKPKKIENSDEILDTDIFFQDAESIKTRAEVESLNRGYEDVDRTVGSDVFGKVNEVKTTDIERIYTDSAPEEIVDGVLYKSLDSVLHESMIPYSEHVILDRALPRVEDGLKPVQRRILYDMLELGNLPDKPFKKSARIVGDCLGKYHPHGDSSVYEALVRMAQPFNFNEVLVQGHGNFGSIDGDGAAAMRYTEARLSPLALELLRDLDKNTVKWGLNFDDTLKEPEMLPGRFPNLLVNGSTGIAVGLATNIPPHNLGECIDGVVAYIDNPKITLKEMLKIIKGPDFPTGGYILSNSELYQAYETGRGKLYVRAKMHIEGSDKKSIVITELPYQVNKANLLQKIAQMKDDEKYGLSGIQEIRDESDREGMRAVIKLKKDASVNKIYNSLLKNTELQGTFGVNMVAIAGGKPKQMGLLDIISYYAEYQREVVLRRTRYDLEQAKERAHILQGLIIAIRNIDAVVKIIKTSQNTTEAKTRLKDKFKLSDRQAQAILDMRLARLTSLEVYKLENELKELEELIKKYTEIVNSTKKQFSVVKSEMLAIKKQYKRDRVTNYLKETTELKVEEEKEKVVEVKEYMLIKTADEKLKAVSMKNYNMSNRAISDNAFPNEVITLAHKTNSLSTILAFTNFGNCHKVKMSMINETKYKDKGVDDWVVFKTLQKNEHIVAFFNEEDMQLEGNLMFYTKFGMIKKTERKEYMLLKTTYQAIKLKDGDELLNVEEEKKMTYNLAFVTKEGMVLNAKTDDIPLQGRVAGGVKGINLSGNDYCVCVESSENMEGELVVVSSTGQCKRVILATIDESARYRKGIKILAEDVAFCTLVKKPMTICVVDRENNLYYKSSDLIHIMSRLDKGKPFEKTKKMMFVSKVFVAIE